MPVVILSTLCGSGNFLAGQFPSIEKVLIIAIGGVSILSENNRVASLAWGKFYASIKFEIQLRTEDRSNAKDLMTNLLAEYNRLYEISPPLLRRFVDKMCKKLQGLVLDRFKIPFYMNGYRHCASFQDGQEFIDNSLSDEKHSD